MNTAFYDANYLFKLQSGEAGAAEVRSHATTVDVLVCSLHGRAEFASAAEHGFAEIYSNDKHLLAATPLFGLRGVNVIA